MLMLQYSQSSLNELLNSDRHVDHDKHLQSQPTSKGAYTMLSLKIPQILVDRDRHLHSQPSSEVVIVSACHGPHAYLNSAIRLMKIDCTATSA